MVSLKQTTKKYHGRKAETYDEIRTTQKRWDIENRTVAAMIPDNVTSVLDVPVGTGRFLPLYANLKLNTVIGIDASEAMLTLAKKKRARGIGKLNLYVGDASEIGGAAKETMIDVVVCVRFLDLIDEESMTKVMKQICGIAQRCVILTIRLGDEYVPKVNTATHSRKKFNALVKRLGWKIGESVSVFDAGWSIIKLERLKK